MSENRLENDAFVFPSCPTKPRVPSDKEVEALDALRAIKDSARALKERMKALRGESTEKAGVEIAEIEKELNRMRVEWDSWEKKRLAAARERMILLGHEEGGAGDLGTLKIED